MVARYLDCVLVAVYAVAIVLANWLVATYGQAALPFTAVLLIPFDLVIRDLLQDRWQDASPTTLRMRMGVLIFGGALLSCLLFPHSLRVSAASFLAFSITGLADALTYQWMIRYGRLFRINLATIVGAAIDSIVFATTAFDQVDSWLVVAQIGTKVLGGFVWSLLLFRLFRKRPCTPSRKRFGSRPHTSSQIMMGSAEGFMGTHGSDEL